MSGQKNIDTVAGVIERPGKAGRLFVVRLEDGRIIEAVMKVQMMRAKIGCLLGSVAGHRVLVYFPAAPKPPRIVDITAKPGSGDPL